MVSVTSFLELGQGNIIILRKRKKICISGTFLEEAKQIEALFLLSFVQALWPFIKVLDVSQKSQALLVSQAITFTHSSKIRLSLLTWSYCNMGKKKSLSHAIYETCTCMETWVSLFADVFMCWGYQAPVAFCSHLLFQKLHLKSDWDVFSLLHYYNRELFVALKSFS